MTNDGDKQGWEYAVVIRDRLKKAAVNVVVPEAILMGEIADAYKAGFKEGQKSQDRPTTK